MNKKLNSVTSYLGYKSLVRIHIISPNAIAQTHLRTVHHNFVDSAVHMIAEVQKMVVALVAHWHVWLLRPRHLVHLPVFGISHPRVIFEIFPPETSKKACLHLEALVMVHRWSFLALEVSVHQSTTSSPFTLLYVNLAKK